MIRMPPSPRPVDGAATRRSRRGRRAAAILLALTGSLWPASLPGCTAASPDKRLPGPGTQPATAPTTAPAPAATTGPAQAIHAGDLFVLRRLAGAYDITRNEATTSAVPFTLEPHAQGGWVLSVGELRRIYLSAQADGSVVVAREEDSRENVAVTYTPTLRMLPSRLTPHHVEEFDCQMVVRDLKDQSVRDKGDCRYSVEYLGEQRVQTPAGEFTAHMVRSTRQMNLNLASVRVTILSAYVPQRGNVLERVEETRRMLGLFSSKATEESRLVR